MNKGSSALAIALRWLAALWMVSWALYVGLMDTPRLTTLPYSPSGFHVRSTYAGNQIAMATECGCRRKRLAPESA
jgi:hypothetical protein